MEAGGGPEDRAAADKVTGADDVVKFPLSLLQHGVKQGVNDRAQDV